MTLVRPISETPTPGLVDVAADGHLRLLRLDRIKDRLAAEVRAALTGVAMVLRR